MLWLSTSDQMYGLYFYWKKTLFQNCNAFVNKSIYFFSEVLFTLKEKIRPFGQRTLQIQYWRNLVLYLLARES